MCYPQPKPISEFWFLPQTHHVRQLELPNSRLPAHGRSDREAALEAAFTLDGLRRLLATGLDGGLSLNPRGWAIFLLSCIIPAAFLSCEGFVWCYATPG